MSEFFKRITSGALFCILFFYVFFYLPPYAFTFLLLAIVAEILIFEWPHLVHIHGNAFWILTLIYPITPFCLLIYMNHHALGHALLPFLFITVWSNDTGAYCIGKLFGKHRLLPTISPGKTWEGFYGGLFFCVLVTGLLFHYYVPTHSYSTIIAVSIMISVFATAGDLFESWLKRKAGIKDSGSIMPGHGGFLDRFDSILFVSVPFSLYCFFLPNSLP